MPVTDNFMPTLGLAQACLCLYLYLYRLFRLFHLCHDLSSGLCHEMILAQRCPC